MAGKEHHSNTNRVQKWSKGYSITTIGPRSLEGLREYLRSQPARHSNERIPGWKGDAAEYEIAGQEQWIGSDRTTFRR